MKAKTDETLEEIWDIRRRIAKKYGYDPKRQLAHYQKKQKKTHARLFKGIAALSKPRQ